MYIVRSQSAPNSRFTGHTSSILYRSLKLTASFIKYTVIKLRNHLVFTERTLTRTFENNIPICQSIEMIVYLK